MSIADAIERAKRLARERAHADTTTPRAAPQRSAVSLLQPAPSGSGSLPPPAFVPRELPAVPYDPVVSAANRIIVAETASGDFRSATARYRMLRTRLLQRARSSGWTTIGITSPGPGEGKTVTAINLAISIAREGNNRVFLLDVDMRNPSVCRYLGISPARELTDYFQGRCGADDVLFTPGIDNLVVAGSLVAIPDASEVLSTPRLDDLLATVQRRASNALVVLDLPPVVNTDDALIVAPRVDAMVLVVSESRTRRDSLGTAMGLLADFTLAGVVLNQSMEFLGADYGPY